MPDIELPLKVLLFSIMLLLFLLGAVVGWLLA